LSRISLEPSTVIWEAICYSWIERCSENINIFIFRFSKGLQANTDVAPWSRSASHYALSILRSRLGVVKPIRAKWRRMLKLSIQAQTYTGQ
jgi:hypothetical protein